MLKLTGAIILGSALMLPLAAQPQRDRDDERREERNQRYYDKDRRDYHNWNESEERAWRRYWQERHREAVEWQRAKEEQREAYWRWRHNHPDSTFRPERH
jgi:hypothetical protein